MDEMNEDVIKNLDPMLYWCGRFLPLADSMGILRSRVLLRAFMPMAKFLPPVPVKREPKKKRLTAAVAEGEKEGHEWWRLSLLDRTITIPYTRKVYDIIYYVMEVDKKYAGEFRFKHIYALHQTLAKDELLKNSTINFPPRFLFTTPTSADIEQRRQMLEKYLVFIMSDPEICASAHFIHFIRNHRKWKGELPLLKSPLLDMD
jgi:hypothetical protein